MIWKISTLFSTQWRDKFFVSKKKPRSRVQVNSEKSFITRGRSLWMWIIRERRRNLFWSRWMRFCVLTQQCRDWAWFWFRTRRRRQLNRSMLQILKKSYFLEKDFRILFDEPLDSQFKKSSIEDMHNNLLDNLVITDKMFQSWDQRGFHIMCLCSSRWFFNF